jgi:hypothetical protein
MDRLKLQRVPVTSRRRKRVPAPEISVELRDIARDYATTPPTRAHPAWAASVVTILITHYGRAFLKKFHAAP